MVILQLRGGQKHTVKPDTGMSIWKVLGQANRTQLVHGPRPSASARVRWSPKYRDFARTVVRRRPPEFACIGVTIGVSIASGQRPHVSVAVQDSLQYVHG